MWLEDDGVAGRMRRYGHLHIVVMCRRGGARNRCEKSVPDRLTRFFGRGVARLSVRWRICGAVPDVKKQSAL